MDCLWGKNSKKQMIHLYADLELRTEDHKGEITQLTTWGVVSGNGGLKTGIFTVE